MNIVYHIMCVVPNHGARGSETPKKNLTFFLTFFINSIITNHDKL